MVEHQAESRESYQESSIIRKPRHTCCEFHSRLTPSSFLYIMCKHSRFSFSLAYRETLLNQCFIALFTEVKSNVYEFGNSTAAFTVRRRSLFLSLEMNLCWDSFKCVWKVSERQAVNTITRRIIVYLWIRLINTIFYLPLYSVYFFSYHSKACKIYYKQSLE